MDSPLVISALFLVLVGALVLATTALPAGTEPARAPAGAVAKS